MTSGGGEWASLNFATPTFEQITISNWNIQWVYLEDGPRGANWYIHRYTETGDRQYTLCPPCGPFSVSYARPYIGAQTVPTSNCINCGNDE